MAWLPHLDVSILPDSSLLTITSVILKAELQLFFLSSGERGHGSDIIEPVLLILFVLLSFYVSFTVVLEECTLASLMCVLVLSSFLLDNTL